MSILKVFGYILAGLMVLALFLGALLFVITLAWMARIVFILVAIVALIMYALKELFTGFLRRRRSP